MKRDAKYFRLLQTVCTRIEADPKIPLSQIATMLLALSYSAGPTVLEMFLKEVDMSETTRAAIVSLNTYLKRHDA